MGFLLLRVSLPTAALASHFHLREKETSEMPRKINSDAENIKSFPWACGTDAFYFREYAFYA